MPSQGLQKHFRVARVDMFFCLNINSQLIKYIYIITQALQRWLISQYIVWMGTTEHSVSIHWDNSDSQRNADKVMNYCVRTIKLPAWSPSMSASSGSSASGHTCGWTLTSRLRLSQLVCSRDDPAIPPTVSRTRWVTSWTEISKCNHSISRSQQKLQMCSIPADLLSPSYSLGWGAYWRHHWESCQQQKMLLNNTNDKYKCVCLLFNYMGTWLLILSCYRPVITACL